MSGLFLFMSVCLVCCVAVSLFVCVADVCLFPDCTLEGVSVYVFCCCCCSIVCFCLLVDCWFCALFLFAF